MDGSVYDHIQDRARKTSEEGAEGKDEEKCREEVATAPRIESRQDDGGAKEKEERSNHSPSESRPHRFNHRRMNEEVRNNL